MSWQVGTICNAVVAVAYFLIALTVALPLARSHQLRSNPLGAATAAIFVTSAVHHAVHSIHLLMPSLMAGDTAGIAMRQAWGWPLVCWDAVSAAVAIYYWTLRRSYASPGGAQLFEDVRRREQQALELNDSVLQGLVVAKMALDLDDPARAGRALESSIDAASRMITDLLGSEHSANALLRTTPAAVHLVPHAGTHHERPAE